jgi:glycosyltransferase involved in cell wall biosynthesis
MTHGLSAPKLSALVVCHNEAHQLADCLRLLTFADELVVVLDRCTDGSKAIAESFGAILVEGAWPLEGPRRNSGIEKCSGDWIVEVDADERLSQALAGEIRQTIAHASPGFFLIPFDNYVGARLVRYGWAGVWGVRAAPRLFSKGAKIWGDQRIHPRLQLMGPKRSLTVPMVHYVDRNLSDMLQRLDRYTTQRAADLRASGDIGSLRTAIRRFFSRFIKCYFQDHGYREGGWGFVIALMGGLYPLLSHLKARLDQEP